MFGSRLEDRVYKQRPTDGSKSYREHARCTAGLLNDSRDAASEHMAMESSIEKTVGKGTN